MTNSAIPGFAIGHWTHPTGRTGCTVILTDRPAVAVCEVRGGAPGTRETNLMTAGSLVRRVDAVLLTGGSAFGLAAADGVVHWLREHGRGFPTPFLPVPIVAAAVVYDLNGPDLVFPDAEAGYAACRAARPDQWRGGRFGAGTATTVGKLLGHQRATPPGIGTHVLASEGGHLGVLAVVNAVGNIVDPATGGILAGIRADDGGWIDSREAILNLSEPESAAGTNTTLIVVMTDLALDYHALTRMAIAAHDALARVIRPAHTILDGDTVFVLAVDETPTPAARIMKIAAATEVAVERALLASALTAE